MSLPVVQPVSTTRQDCARCPQLRKCWNMKGNPSDQALVINLLVCRLKLGIKSNATTRLLLRMLRPKIVKTAAWIQNKVAPATVDMEELLVDLESTAIEHLTVHYDMGEVAWPLHYLFGHPSGSIRGWAMNYVNKVKRHNATHFSYGLAADEASDEHSRGDFESRINRLNLALTRIKDAPPQSYEPVEPQTEVPHEAAMGAVDDGYSLTLSEYRVLKFCLNNADPHRAHSPIAGLHTWLAEHAGVKRKTISKYYRQASYRAIEAAAKTDAVLVARGVDTSAVNKARRTRWLHGDIEAEDRLTPSEIEGLLKAAQRDDVALLDVCWAYGISDKAYYKLRDKYAGMTLEEIDYHEQQ